MIDLHTHILYGIDDGAKTLENAIELLKEEKENGFTSIVLTPHYMYNTKYNANNKVKNKIFKELQKKAKELELNLYLANEVYSTNNILELLDNKEILTINNTKYMLIELPLNGSIRYLTTLLYDLNSRGITPILAHPERYLSLQNNKEKIKTLLEYDIVFQSNLGSLVGLYGIKAKKLVKWLLKNDLIQIMATDIHRPNTIKTNKAIKKLVKIVGTSKKDELLITNPKLVLDNKEIEVNISKVYKNKYSL